MHSLKSRPSEAGHALLYVMIMLVVCLLTATALCLYSSVNARQNQRNNDYYSGISAAEASTEKALSIITSDFRDYGIGYVSNRLDTYRRAIPSSSEAPEWGNFDFMDLAGTAQRLEVQYTSLNGFLTLGGQYGSLKGFKDRVRILSNARSHSSLDGVVGSVYQDIEFTSIPIFQFAVFYNVALEFTPLPNMTMTGPVHCNTNIYLSPQGTCILTFNSDVTSAGTICQCANPASPLTLGTGTVVFNARHDSGVSTLSLPIGTNNSPAAVHQVVEVPPAGENPNSSVGQQRYYNKADLIITVTNNNISVVSGLWNNFATALSSNEVSLFVKTNASFYNKREKKTVKSIDIDVAKLVQWNATNTSIRPSLPLTDVRVLFVLDKRSLATTNQSGVRLINGTNLPPQGLTTATASPAYTLGNYNLSTGYSGTNTINTKPSSIVADAITILSTVWNDTSGTNTLGARVAADTTVNAAFLAGIVTSTLASDSGGIENYPRFLEDWGNGTKTLTYNGSMVVMYPSQIATNLWLGIGSTYDIYNPPTRNWSLDQNFSQKSKLPPASPSLVVLVRANWRTPAAYTTNVMAGY